MRIEKIRLKNLNSLYGEWEIDLTDQAYLSDGIFAITGPTGSGKTTVLDALSLALYGRTPRLSNVNQGANEIMSRQAADCKAEVIFKTQAGRFLCQWSQRRAHNKADGNLQKVTHEISLINDGSSAGQIMSSAISKTHRETASVTGLDYNQFTRSTLLAQGAFAAFLEASPSDRSPILEQITGTEVYSQISTSAHARWKAERKELEAKKLLLDNLSILVAEEEEAMRLEVATLHGKITALEAAIEEKNKFLAWREQLASLSSELEALKARADALAQAVEDFKPKQARLDLAINVLELSADHSALASQRQERQQNMAELARAREALPTLMAQAEKAKEDLASSEALALEAKKALEAKAPVITRVRELDVKGKETNGRLAKAAENLNNLTVEGAKLAKAIQDKEATGLRLDAEDKDIGDRLAKGSGDERLAERLPAMKEQAKANLKLLETVKQKTRDSKKISINADACREKILSLGNGLRDLKLKSEASQKEKYSLEHQIEEKLGGRLLADWQRDIDSLGARIGVFKDVLAAVTHWQDLSDSLREAESSLSTKENEIALAKGEMAAAEAAALGLEAKAQGLERDLAKQRNIESLEELRGALADGEPCPLCGSTVHPYSQDGPQETALSDKALADARKELKSALKKLDAIRAAVIKLDSDKGQLEKQKADLGPRLQKISGQIGELLDPVWPLAKADPSPMPTDKAVLAELLGQAARDSDFAVSRLKQRVTAVMDSIGKLQKANKQADGINAEVTSLERAIEAATSEMESDLRIIAINDEEIKSLSQEARQYYETLDMEVKGYGVSCDSMTQAFAIIEDRIAARDNDIKRRNSLKAERASLLATLVGLRESLATNQEKLSKAAQEHEETNNALGLLAEERKSLLGNLDPSDVEKTLGESRDKAEKLLGEARGSWEEKNMGLSLARQSESSLAQSLAKRETDLAVLENSFAKRLASFELSSEEDYLRAALPEAQRKALSEESKRLADSQLEILTQSREKANELEAKKNLRLTGESATELKEALGSLLAQKPSLIEEYSLKNGRLAENERQKERHLEGQQKYEQAVKDSRVWEKLDILIGSSDGKKYRNYVQILTFDTLLALANQRLEKMSPRYKLYHDRSRPLETMVRDEFQAGDIRPTKNLSGGESFIVSLSLALGLSKMAGEKVRVDSLFLDEGFGTLDEDALDAALDALSALRQDGKMIGLISHVPALTERIGARIEVSPVSAGRSVIEGPGCRKLG